MKKTKKICLAWHNFNSANYGVGALAIAHFAMIVESARKNNIQLEIDTLGTSNHSGLSIKEEIEKRFDVRINHIDYGLRDLYNKFKRLDFSPLSAFKKYDLIFDIGEGDSFTDIYGLKRFSILSLTKLLALRSSAKLVIAPQTIGPFKSTVTAAIAKHLLAQSDAVYTRDDKSSKYLDTLAINNTLVSDVAFGLPYDKQPPLENSVGINISGLLWNGGYTNKNQFNLSIDYKIFTKNLIDGFLARGKRVHLISHVITDKIEVEDDYRVCKLIKNEYKDNPNVLLAPKFTSPISAKSYISQMSFFVGARMHATIGALSSGVPTIPIAYSRKFSGVFGSIGYKYTLDAYDSKNTTDILSECFELYDKHYFEMKDAQQKSITNAKNINQRYQDFLAELIK